METQYECLDGREEEKERMMELVLQASSDDVTGQEDYCC